MPDFSQTLAKVPIFSDLTPAEMSFIAPRLAPRQCAPGELIFAEGERFVSLSVPLFSNFQAAPAAMARVREILIEEDEGAGDCSSLKINRSNVVRLDA